MFDQSQHPGNNALKILFVCLGNICRSPSAEGVFRQKLEQAGLSDRVEVDSAGTHAYHVGSPPDDRAAAAASRRGIDLSGLRGRQVSPDDFEHYDYILAMDRDNLADLLAMSPAEHQHKIRLFLDFAGAGTGPEVPDPYYGGSDGFERVLDMLEQASDGLLLVLKNQLAA